MPLSSVLHKDNRRHGLPSLEMMNRMRSIAVFDGIEANMLIREIALHQCLELMHRSGFGRLACSLHNQPYVVPIYLHTAGPHLRVYNRWKED